jgi:hypothetical protein
MEMLKPDDQFHAGKSGQEFKEILASKLKNYPYEKFGLDLSDVSYMDTYSFRLVFDSLPKFSVVIPPKASKVVEMYDLWVDSKKGLKKSIKELV